MCDTAGWSAALRCALPGRAGQTVKRELRRGRNIRARAVDRESGERNVFARGPASKGAHPRAQNRRCPDGLSHTGQPSACCSGQVLCLSVGRRPVARSRADPAYAPTAGADMICCAGGIHAKSKRASGRPYMAWKFLHLSSVSLGRRENARTSVRPVRVEHGRASRSAYYRKRP
jgi:hypothetical protein